MDRNHVNANVSDFKEPESSSSLSKAPLFPSSRLMLCVMGFIGAFCINIMRNNLSVGIVFMTDRNTTTGNHGTATDETKDLMRQMNIGLTNDYYSLYGSSTNGNGKGEFSWSKELQGTILSAFSYGYVCTQFISGLLSSRYGAKRTIFAGVLISTAMTLLSPLAARASPNILIACQFTMGLGQAVYFPGFYTLFSKWTPPDERSVQMNIMQVGGTVGIIISLFVAGYICEYLGWDYLFYIFGGVTLLWLIAWCFLVFDTPDKHPRISLKERNYIFTSLRLEDKYFNQTTNLIEVPWKQIFTSSALWIINVSGWCQAFLSIVAQKMFPQYLHDVLNIAITENGVLSSLPQITLLVTTMIAAPLADQMIRWGMASLNVRKIMQFVGCVAPLPFTIAIGYLTHGDSVLAVTCLCCLVGASGFARSGAFLSVLEIAPRYASITMGISNTVGYSIPGFVAPTVVDVITKHGTQAEWRTAFSLTGGISAFGGVFYLIRRKGDVQSWGIKDDRNGDSDEDNSDIVEPLIEA